VNAPLEHVAIAAWLYLLMLGTLIAFRLAGVLLIFRGKTAANHE
jgi:hypothetical protein